MLESGKSWEDVEELSRRKTKILVVDDEEAIAEIAAAMLTYEGYFVETATNGDVAFDLYCQYLSFTRGSGSFADFSSHSAALASNSAMVAFGGTIGWCIDLIVFITAKQIVSSSRGIQLHKLIETLPVPLQLDWQSESGPVIRCSIAQITPETISRSRSNRVTISSASWVSGDLS